MVVDLDIDDGSVRRCCLDLGGEDDEKPMMNEAQLPFVYATVPTWAGGSPQ